MGELLSASSLLLGVLGVLYGLWYATLTDALQTVVDKHAANRTAPRKRVTSVVFARALPLALGSIAVAAAFVPDAYAIFTTSLATYKANGWAALSNYDAVRTAFVIVVLFAVFLALHLLWLLIRIVVLRCRLASSKDTPDSGI